MLVLGVCSGYLTSHRTFGDEQKDGDGTIAKQEFKRWQAAEKKLHPPHPGYAFKVFHAARVHSCTNLVTAHLHELAALVVPRQYLTLTCFGCR